MMVFSLLFDNSINNFSFSCFYAAVIDALEFPLILANLVLCYVAFLVSSHMCMISIADIYFLIWKYDTDIALLKEKIRYMQQLLKKSSGYLRFPGH